MAQYTFDTTVRYDPTTGDVLGIGTGQNGGTLDDGVAAGLGSGTFSTGQDTNITGGLADGAYVGTITLDNGSGPVEFVILDPGNDGVGPFTAYALTGDPNWTDTLADPIADTTPDTGAFTVCFAEGSLIATPDGERAVETLRIGDLVTTADGRTVPVKWLGKQTVHRLFAGERAIPVRVKAGALGGGLPHTDLLLTAEHALVLDGLAINAGALVNGSTIVWHDSVPDTATYYHVETEDHDVVLANGAPAETFVDYATRRRFNNYAEYVALYGDERVIAEMPLPRISSARLLPPAIRARLAGRDAA